MKTENPTLVRQAHTRSAQGDLPAILDLFDPDLEWTFLDPSQADPVPQVCRGRHELGLRLARQRAKGLPTTPEEVIEAGGKVVVITHTPGLDALRERKADDRNFDVLTFRGGRIVALRACRTRAEAMSLAGPA